ncbi:hypothetical protein HPB51_026288 [Rhipicephalus microplus]|uniref:Uncharacterized protein n=1 Tax=Rhipicephalus microplus TaxID=6941 RepID=A0A9J6D7Z0_RHIMP|nr:hypothetical protein HPB51_026288 [Rhipicephalus microplus]
MASRWFLSEAGRKAAGLAGLTGGFIGAMVGLLPHTHLLEQYKGIVQAYKDGKPVALDPAVKKRAEEVLRSVDLDDMQKDSISFFHVPILDTFFAGSTTAFKGVIIGLPLTFSYTTKEDVQTRSLLIHGSKAPDWETKEAEQLKKSLVLSDKRRVVALHATVYIGFKDAMSQYWDKKADSVAASLGRDYVEGGVEYYEKLLQRNRALRELLGDEGRKYYTSKGNIDRIIRSDHVPITHRLEGLKNRLQTASKSELAA